MGSVDIPKGISVLAHAHIEMIRAFRGSTQLQFVQQELHFTQAATLHTYLDGTDEQAISAQRVIAEEILELGEEFAIIAAYRVVEQHTKLLTRWIDKSYTRFAWPSFVKLLRARVDIDIATLDGVASVDELRLLNNAIKHDAHVTAELARYPGWTEGERVHPLAPTFERLAPQVPVFIAALGRAVIPAKLARVYREMP